MANDETKVTVSIKVEKSNGNQVTIEASGKLIPDDDSYESIGSAIKGAGELAASLAEE